MKIIKPRLATTRITKTNGKVLLGWIVNANEQQVALLLIGKIVEQILRSEIASSENKMKSLINERLLNGMSKLEATSPLSYIISFK